MQGWLGNFSRAIETVRKSQTEVLEVKNTAPEKKNVSHRLLSRLGTAKERIGEHEDRLVEVI